LAIGLRDRPFEFSFLDFPQAGRCSGIPTKRETRKKGMRITTAHPVPFTKRGKQAVNLREIFLTFAVFTALSG
jgi:hypothetical protein